jgi:hypothetical protein
MWLRTFTAFYILLISPLCPAQGILEFKISKPYCLLNFLETAAGQGSRSQTLKQHIDKKKTDNDSLFQKILRDFSGINLDYAWKREEFPARRRQYRSTYDLICIAAVQSGSMSEFKLKCAGVLPAGELQKLLSLLLAAEKYYDDWIWKEEEPKLQAQLKSLQAYGAKCNVLFSTFRDFYGSAWISDMPFTVALYPIPGKRGHSTATPHANSLCVGVLTGETDHASRLGVVMHEICHVLYDEQPAELQHRLDSVFLKEKSDCGSAAYNFFDEALATALGNGYSYQYLQGRPDSADWYSNVYINGFARALYPKIEQVLLHQRQLDEGFILTSMAMFCHTFPKAASDYGILFNNINVYALAENRAERHEIFSALGEYFQLTYTSMYSPMFDKESLASMKSESGTRLIVVDRDHAQSMARLSKIFPSLPSMLKGKAKEEYILSFFDKNRRPVVLVSLNGIQSMPRAARKLYQLRYISEGQPYAALN